MKTPPAQLGAADNDCIIHSEFRAFDIWAICLVKDSFTAGTEAIGWILIVQRNQSIQADSGSWPDEKYHCRVCIVAQNSLSFIPLIGGAGSESAATSTAKLA